MGGLDGLRVTLLTASASRLGGGVATALYSHAAMLREAGAEVTVVALADRHSEDDRAMLGPTPMRTARVSGPAFFGYAPDLVDELLESFSCSAAILRRRGAARRQKRRKRAVGAVPDFRSTMACAMAPSAMTDRSIR